MRVSLIVVAFVVALGFSTCDVCEQIEGSHKRINISTFDSDTTKIDSITLVGKSLTIMPQSNNYVYITLNPNDTVSGFNVYIDGEHRYMQIVYNNKLTYDCNQYLMVYAIDTIYHNFTKLEYDENDATLLNYISTIKVKK